MMRITRIFVAIVLPIFLLQTIGTFVLGRTEWEKSLVPDKADATKAFDITNPVPLTTSKVVGSPDPPPPYRVKRLYPNLKINYPIAVRHQPSSDRLWFITQGAPYGRTDIHRMKDDPNTREFE